MGEGHDAQLSGDRLRDQYARGALNRVAAHNAATARKVEPPDPDDEKPPTAAELAYLEDMGMDSEPMRRRAIATRILGPPTGR